jgi:hypothetical protein
VSTNDWAFELKQVSWANDGTELDAEGPVAGEATDQRVRRTVSTVAEPRPAVAFFGGRRS